MKKLYVLAAFALFSLTVFSQPVLHWRFANQTVFNNGTDDVLQFDVELSCTDAGTFHSSMQIFFDYNTLGFGTTIVANNKISYSRLALMQGQFSGTDKYNVVNTADNTDHTFAILTEAAIIIPGATFMNEVPQLPAWSGFFQFQIIIADPAQVAGIFFRADRMDAGNYYVDATHPTETKYGIPPVYAGVYENDLLNYQLSDAGTLTGSVTDLSANPLAGATVTAGTFSTTTLADGSYSMLVNSGTYDVTATAPCHDPVTVSGVVVTQGNTTTTNFALPGDMNGTLSGTVTDLITLLPVGGVTVTAGAFSATTLADGSYTLGGVTPGTYDVVFSKAGYLDYTEGGLAVPCNFTTTVNAQLCPQANAGTLSGTVTDLITLLPLGGVLVDAGSYSTTTAGDGSYSLMLPEGNYNVTASLAGYVSMTQPAVITASGNVVLDFALTPAVNGTLSAYVYDCLTAAPIANATVTAGSASGLTNASGMCIMPVLNGTYTVTVTHPDYQTENIPGVVITGYLTTNLSVPMIQSNPSAPVVFWQFNNPQIIDCDTLQFDVELKCSQAGTYHSSTQIYWRYNTQAFGTNIVGNGKVVFQKLDLLSGSFAGQPKYTINNITDNNDSTFAILFEPSFLIPGSTFMNEVTTSFQPFGRFKVKIQDHSKLAGVYFLATNAGVGMMNGGQYYVDATHPDETKYGIPPLYAGVYDNDLLVYPLAGTGTLAGIVTDQTTLLPLAGVTVTAGIYSATTLADGSYSLTVAPGTYDMNFSLAGYLGYTAEGIIVTCDDVITVNAQLFPLSAAGTLSGMVTDDLTGLPVAGALVLAGTYSTSTAADGTYSFILPAGNYTVTVSKTGYLTFTQPAVIPASGNVVLNVSLVPLVYGTLSAHVYDALTMAPVANATVTIGDSTGATNASGDYVVQVLYGTYAVTATHPSYNPNTISGVVITGGVTTNLAIPLVLANPPEPVVSWQFANAQLIGCDTLQFDIELKCSQAGTFHSSTQVYWRYNTQAFGTNIVGNGKVVFQELALLSGSFSGQPKYTINNIADNNDSTFAILFEPTFLIPGATFMNEVTTSYQPFGRFKVRIQDPSQLAGIYFLANYSGVGMMDGGQYYVDATHPAETKYGIPPLYAGLYDNDLLAQSLQCSATFVWTGAVSSDWFTPGNWNLNAVPGAGDDAEIPPVDAPFPIIIGGSATVSSLTIYTGANLVIDPTGALTTNGLLTNDGVFTINSNGTGAAGSYIDLGGFAGTGLYQFNRDMLGTGNPPILTYQGPGIPPLVQITDFHGWHLISPPLDGMSNWDIFDYWINEWNAGTQLWQDYAPGANYPCVTGADNPWNAMTGYSVKRDISYDPYCNTVNPGTGNVIEFAQYMPFHTGAYNTGVVAGWNLLGNPYPSPIDPNTLTFPANINGSVYYYDDVSLNYVSWAGGVGPNIPATQGFFVNATGADLLGVANANRTHAGANLYYKESVTDLLELQVVGNNSYDRTYIRFLDEATSGFDRLWDAYKIRSEVPEVPTMYTVGGADLSINSMPATDRVPVYFSSGADGIFTITAVTDLGTVYLEDKEEGIFHNLSTPYQFSFTTGGRADRFVIHFNLSDELANNGFAIYSYANSIYVNNLNNVRGTIMVYTMMGQEVDRVALEPGLNILNVRKQNAAYVVKVSGSTATVSEKVYTW